MPHRASTRWCPTPEQLLILEDIYRRGLRSPNTTQIQRITAHLSFHGKIEGKNVFYWFQNHKARDRQKIRRSLNKQQQGQNTPLILHQGGLQDATQEMNTGCEPDHTETKEMERSASYEDEWMAMMGIGLAPCYKPPKTLELFPLKSPCLKEENTLTIPY